MRKKTTHRLQIPIKKAMATRAKYIDRDDLRMLITFIDTDDNEFEFELSPLEMRAFDHHFRAAKKAIDNYSGE